MSRDRLSISTRVFLITGVDKEEQRRLGKDISKLGGVYSKSEHFQSNATHVICGKLTRSEKFLGALTLGRWVVRPEFIKASLEAGQWLDEVDYEWSSLYLQHQEQVLATAAKYNRWRVSSSKEKLFCDWQVAVVMDNPCRQAVYKRLLALGGARIMDVKLPLKNPDRCADDLTYLFADRTMLPLAQSLQSRGVLCLRADFISDYIVLNPRPDPMGYLLLLGSDGHTPSAASSLHSSLDDSTCVSMLKPAPQSLFSSSSATACTKDDGYSQHDDDILVFTKCMSSERSTVSDSSSKITSCSSSKNISSGRTIEAAALGINGFTNDSDFEDSKAYKDYARVHHESISVEACEPSTSDSANVEGLVKQGNTALASDDGRCIRAKMESSDSNDDFFLNAVKEEKRTSTDIISVSIHEESRPSYSAQYGMVMDLHKGQSILTAGEECVRCENAIYSSSDDSDVVIVTDSESDIEDYTTAGARTHSGANCLSLCAERQGTGSCAKLQERKLQTVQQQTSLSVKQDQEYLCVKQDQKYLPVKMNQKTLPVKALKDSPSLRWDKESTKQKQLTLPVQMSLFGDHRDQARTTTGGTDHRHKAGSSQARTTTGGTDHKHKAGSSQACTTKDGRGHKIGHFLDCIRHEGDPEVMSAADSGAKTAGSGDKTAGSGAKTAGSGDKTAGSGDKTAGSGDKTAGSGALALFCSALRNDDRQLAASSGMAFGANLPCPFCCQVVMTAVQPSSAHQWSSVALSTSTAVTSSLLLPSVSAAMTSSQFSSASTAVISSQSSTLTAKMTSQSSALTAATSSSRSSSGNVFSFKHIRRKRQGEGHVMVADRRKRKGEGHVMVGKKRELKKLMTIVPKRPFTQTLVSVSPRKVQSSLQQWFQPSGKENMHRLATAAESHTQPQQELSLDCKPQLHSAHHISDKTALHTLHKTRPTLRGNKRLIEEVMSSSSEAEGKSSASMSRKRSQMHMTGFFSSKSFGTGNEMTTLSRAGHFSEKVNSESNSAVNADAAVTCGARWLLPSIRWRLSHVPFPQQVDVTQGSRSQAQELEPRRHFTESLSVMICSFLDEKYFEPAMFLADSLARCCPSANLIRHMLKVVKEADNHSLVSHAITLLLSWLDQFPPITKDLRSTYEQALGLHEWANVHKMLEDAVTEAEAGTTSSRSAAETHSGSHLVLRIVVAALEKNFLHFAHSVSQRGRCSCMIVRCLWSPSFQVYPNSRTTELIKFLERALKCFHSTRACWLELLSLVSMATQCCLLADTRWQWSVDGRVGYCSARMVQDIAQAITGEDAPSVEYLQCVLCSVSPSWLLRQIVATLMEDYDDSLLPGGFSAHPITLATIVSKYFFLIPKLSTMDTSNSPSDRKKLKKPAAPVYPNLTAEKINKKNHKGETMLHKAVIGNKIALLEQMLTVPGVDVNCQDYAGWTPLHEACNRGNVECVRMLLNFVPSVTLDNYFYSGSKVRKMRKVDIMLTNSEGITVLHDAVNNQHISVVKLLLQYGGSRLLNARTLLGYTARDLAKTEEMRQLLDTDPCHVSLSQDSVSQELHSQELQCVASSFMYHEVSDSRDDNNTPLSASLHDIRRLLVLLTLLLRSHLQVMNQQRQLTEEYSPQLPNKEHSPKQLKKDHSPQLPNKHSLQDQNKEHSLQQLNKDHSQQFQTKQRSMQDQNKEHSLQQQHHGSLQNQQTGHSQNPQNGHLQTPQNGHLQTPQNGHLQNPQNGHLQTPQKRDSQNQANGQSQNHEETLPPEAEKFGEEDITFWMQSFQRHLKKITSEEVLSSVRVQLAVLETLLTQCCVDEDRA